MNIKEKLINIQVGIKVPKKLYNHFGKYSYRNAEGICEAVKPYLLKEKCTLTLSDSIEEVGGKIYVKAYAVLRDIETDDSITVTASACEEDKKKGMDASQTTGAASSYARKYALNGLFLLDDTKDADSDEYHNEAQRRKQKQESEDKSEQVNPREDKTIENQLIDGKKVQALRELFERHEIDESKVCVLYKVDSISNLTEKKHANIIANLDKIKDQCAT